MTLEKLVSEVFAFPEANVSDSLLFKGIPSWDSLAHMMLIVRVEESYEVQFSGDEIAEIRSVEELRKALQVRGVKL